MKILRLFPLNNYTQFCILFDDGSVLHSQKGVAINAVLRDSFEKFSGKELVIDIEQNEIIDIRVKE